MWVLAWKDDSRRSNSFDKELYTFIYGANVEKHGHRIFPDSLERAQSRGLVVEESDECSDTVIGEQVYMVSSHNHYRKDQHHDLGRAC